MNDPRLVEVLIREQQIQERINALAATIARDYAGKRDIQVLGVLTGAFLFMADLCRALHRAGVAVGNCDFIKASTYGDALKGDTLPTVKLLQCPDKLQGKDILIVEDILDQGITLQGIRTLLLEQKQARSVKVCVLLNKLLPHASPAILAARAAAAPDYVGFEVPDRWVVGYGLDVAGEFRNLPDIHIAREECFRSS